MIISVSGKIGAGKDLVGKIIQYLTLPEHEMTDFETFQAEYLKNTWDTEWEIKKFADKLKDIVCLLIGCTREQLEDREFKEKELDEKWWYYRYLLQEKNSDKLNPILSNEGYLQKQYKFIPKSFVNTMSLEEKNWHKVELIKLTPRKLMQLLGTEAGRRIIHPNIWVNSLFADYKPQRVGIKEIGAEPNEISYWEDIVPNWIITDTRFPNEVQSIKERKGIVIRINRYKQISNNVRVHGTGIPHPSETALDDYKDWDYIINNNGNIEELIEKVKEILIKENVIKN